MRANRSVHRAQRARAQDLETRQAEALEHIATVLTTLAFTQRVTTPALRAWAEAHNLEDDDAPRDLRR